MIPAEIPPEGRSESSYMPVGELDQTATKPGSGEGGGYKIKVFISQAYAGGGMTGHDPGSDTAINRLADELRHHADFDQLKKDASQAFSKCYMEKSPVLQKELLHNAKFGQFIEDLSKEETVPLSELEAELDRGADVEILIEKWRETCIDLCHTMRRKNMIKRDLAMADSYNENMEERIGRVEVYRFVGVEELEQIAETAKFSNLDSFGNAYGNKEIDDHDTKSFTLNRGHFFQKDGKCPIRLAFKDHDLPLEILRMDIMLPVGPKSTKHGQNANPENVHEMELRLPINENERPNIPRDLTAYIPENLLGCISRETLKKLKIEYVVAHEENPV